jgi:very-short-patch-repair endonuclease
MRNIIIPYTRDARLYAKELRSNPTKTELRIWKCIRDKKLGIEFHRQVPMLNYVVDFYCHEIMLAVEIDGLYHSQIAQQLYDYDRQEKLEQKGVSFLRFSNDQVHNNIKNVMLEINSKINELKEIFDG